MTVTVVSSDDKTLIRSAKAHRIELTLNAAPKTVVAAARINQAAFSYPIAQLTVDNTYNWSAVKVGQAVWIGTEPGARDITAGVVRKAPTSTVLYIDAKSLGETGYAAYIHSGLADNYYVTILKHRPPWGLISSIRNGIFYKQWDVTYTDEGSNPNPVARIGTHRAVYAGAGGTAQLKFEAAPFTWGAKSLTARLWNLDGGTLVMGSLTGDWVVGEFTPGFYVVEYTINDSGSKSHTAYRYLWVNPYQDSGEHASFGSRIKWEITRDEQRDGRDIDLTLMGDITADDVYPGQPFLLTERAYYGGNNRLSNEDCRVHNWVGYTSAVNPSRKQRVQRRLNVALQSPITAMRAIPTAPQLVQEVASPATWAEATSTLTNPVGGIWYILQHHAPTILAGHDFYYASGALSIREQSLKFQQDSLAAQVKHFEQTMPGYIGCKSDGTLKLTLSPFHMSNADRNALVQKYLWEAADIDGDDGIDYPFSFTQRTGQVKAYALAYDGGIESRPYASLAPGKAQGQGVGKANVTYMLPYSDAATEQARLNELSGHQYAKENAPTPELGFTVFRNIDIAEPCDRDAWHVLDIPAEYDPYGLGFVLQRAVPSRVSRRWARNGNGTWTKRIRTEFELETFGQPGVTIPVEREGWEDWVTDEGWIQNDVPFDPKIELDPEASPVSSAEIYITFDVGGYEDYVIDPSDNFSGTSTGGVVINAYRANTGGNPVRCARADDAREGAAGITHNANFQVEITLDTTPPVTVTQVRMQIKYQASGFDDLTFDVSTPIGTTTGVPLTEGAYYQFEETGSGVVGSATFVVGVFYSGEKNNASPAEATISLYIDNIEIFYT